MNKLFFRDVRGNIFALDKVVGFVCDETENETHYLAILEGVGSVEITSSMYNELSNMTIILENEEEQGEEQE